MIRAHQYDVLVVGAGPAGTHTALRLARSGWRVALLDSRVFPRKKLCGEFLSPACLPMLDELGLLSGLRRSGAARVSGMQLATSSNRTRGDYRPVGRFKASHGHGLGIRRELLDHQAVQAAQLEEGITVLLGWSVSEPLRDSTGRVTGMRARDPQGRSVELNARFHVVADGLHSRIARSLGWTKPWRGKERFALVARFRGVKPSGEAGVHFVGKNYFAACPVDQDLFTANLVVDGRDLPKGAAALEGFFQEYVQRAPALAERLSGAELIEPIAACGPLRVGVKRYTGPGAALVGDACGFVDPLTGEGLYFAMRGAALLAPAIDLALREPARERAALRRYERGRSWDFAPRYALARLLQRGLRSPGIPERVVGVLASVPGLCDLLLGLTGDYIPAHGLLSPSVWRSAFTGKKPVAG